MTPEGAKIVLSNMGVTEAYGVSGQFRIVRTPSNHNLSMFVKAIATLGVGMVHAEADKAKVSVAVNGDELIFMVK
jgi:putative aminopeptidase FrvX